MASTPGSHKVHVCVIGAGFAGLAAAHTLLTRSKGFVKVTVLEGSNRVGGRAHTAQLPCSGSVEMGANWLHGIVGNPVYDLANEHGLLTQREKGSGWGSPVFVREGEQAPLSEEQASIAIRGIQAYGGVLQSLDGYTAAAEIPEQPKQQDTGQPYLSEDYCVTSVGELLDIKLKDLVSQLNSDERMAQNSSILKEAWQWRENLQRSIEGCNSTYEVCAQGLQEYKELPGPNIPIPCGFQKVAEILSQNMEIEYQKIVEQIKWQQDGGQVTITCKGGAQYFADAVIVSVSVGVLKSSHKDMFCPELPAWKVESIEKIGYGAVDKIFVEFLPSSEFVEEFQSDPKQNEVKDYRLLWKVEDYTTSNSTWERGVYSWRYWGSEFRGSRLGHDKRPCAALWITGEEALAMENMSDQELSEGCIRILEHFPTINRPQNWRDTLKAYRSTWGTDPLFLGSYSYIKCGGSGEHIDKVFRPLHVVKLNSEGRQVEVPVVSFCGEATHRQYFGTVHGAYLSGEIAAQKLLDSLECIA